MNDLKELSDLYMTQVVKEEVADNTPEDVKTRVMQIVKAIRYKARKEGGNIVKAFNDYMGGQSGIGAAERQMIKQRLGLSEEVGITTSEKMKKALKDAQLQKKEAEAIKKVKKEGVKLDYDPLDDPDFDHDEAEKKRGVSGKNNPKGGKKLKDIVKESGWHRRNPEKVGTPADPDYNVLKGKGKPVKASKPATTGKASKQPPGIYKPNKEGKFVKVDETVSPGVSRQLRSVGRKQISRAEKGAGRVHTGGSKSLDPQHTARSTRFVDTSRDAHTGVDSVTGEYKSAEQRKREHKANVARGRASGASMRGENFSNWREDLREIIQQPETDKEMEVKIKEKKIENKIVINPPMQEEIKKMGGEILEMTEVGEDYETQKTAEVLGALKKKKKDFKTRYGKMGPDVMLDVAKKTVKRKGDTSKSDDRYAYESRAFTKVVKDLKKEYPGGVLSTKQDFDNLKKQNASKSLDAKQIQQKDNRSAAQREVDAQYGRTAINQQGRVGT